MENSNRPIVLFRQSNGGVKITEDDTHSPSFIGKKSLNGAWGFLFDVCQKKDGKNLQCIFNVDSGNCREHLVVEGIQFREG